MAYIEYSKEHIKHILMERDNMEPDEAQDVIDEAQEAFDEYMDAMDLEAALGVCEEFFALEPEFLMAFTCML